jgi:hypothetical protein
MKTLYEDTAYIVLELSSEYEALDGIELITYFW